MNSLGLSLTLTLLAWQRTTHALIDTYWTYTGIVGQLEWPVYYPECGGSGQSPINVETTQTTYDPSLTPVQPLGYQQHGNEPFVLINTGHAVEIPLPRWMGLGGLPWYFTAVQLHLHWGNGGREGVGSEHAINGRSADAELHLVHYNSELYANLSTAKTRRDGLAVLGVLIEAGDATNQAFGNILNHLRRVSHAGQRETIPAFDVQSLLPTNLSRYFRYNGSLTTPPCYQSVLWTVFTEKVRVSRAQLKELKTALYSTKAKESEQEVLQDNYRLTQPLNGRSVLVSYPQESVLIYSVGEIVAIVIGALCGCIGLAIVIRFVVKTIRTKDTGKEPKLDLALKLTSSPEKKGDSASSAGFLTLP